MNVIQFSDRCIYGIWNNFKGRVFSAVAVFVAVAFLYLQQKKIFGKVGKI
jgi:hypothetical protein